MTKICTSDRLSSNRSENSLLNLTKKFLKLLRSSKDKSIDINMAAAHLNVQKRRVYDIINVLEGLGLLGKWSVNCSKWIGGDIDNHIASDSDNKENINSEEEKNISKEERTLDCQIEELNREINILSQSEKNLENAYVTFSDLQSIPSLRNKLIFSIKAPSDTVLEVPKYEKGSYKLNLSAESGNIMVYYVSDEQLN
ncbi:Transcription factor E2F6 [Nosema granulosis]|uniref:Transcription factor E2F6 n=1 Tax=Nosema granulosis TaxID=83296 RepID=A0A9P6GW08_9MICR|nr:Transcription factor E2F6 [Nosema granulosis]